MCFSVAIPCILISLPFEEITLRQNLMALAQVVPIITGLLTSLLASTLRRTKGPKDSDPHELAVISNRDLPYLLKAYSFVFFATATAHIGAVAFTATSPALSLTDMFPALLGPSKGWRPSRANGETSDIFKYEMAIYVACVTVWCLYSVFEMRRLGYVRTGQAYTAGLGVLTVLFILGPGAMYAGTWYWREIAVARLSKEEGYDDDGSGILTSRTMSEDK